MERKEPTKKYLSDYFNNKGDVIRSIYEGLKDIPSLKQAYPYLNLNELLMFSATLRKKRKFDPDFAQHLENDFINGMKKLYKNAYAWFKGKLNFGKVKSTYHEEYMQLNPYSYSTFSLRMDALKKEGLDEKFMKILLKEILCICLSMNIMQKSILWMIMILDFYIFNQNILIVVKK